MQCPSVDSRLRGNDTRPLSLALTQQRMRRKTAAISTKQGTHEVQHFEAHRIKSMRCFGVQIAGTFERSLLARAISSKKKIPKINTEIVIASQF